MPHVYTIDGPLGLAGNQAALAYSGRPGVVFNAEGQSEKVSRGWLMGAFFGGVGLAFALSRRLPSGEAGAMLAGGLAAALTTSIISFIGYRGHTA